MAEEDKDKEKENENEQDRVKSERMDHLEKGAKVGKSKEKDK
jgi:hypothetical protein